MLEQKFLSIHIPLNEDTNGLFDGSYLKSFPNLKVVINTARGEVLKTEDLVDMLENGKLYGAVLDVLENEKLDTYSSRENDLMRSTR